ncbi:hypothetical protein [Cellulomonas sp. URHB0016]
MDLFRRLRPRADPPLEIRVAEGFLAAEAPALQRSFVAALHPRERHDHADVPDLLEIGRGAGDRLVVIWRNLVVGFVPAERAPQIEAALPAGPRAGVTVRGVVHQAHGLWRVWVGDGPADGLREPPAGLDTLPVPEDTIFGVRLVRRDDHGPA